MRLVFDASALLNIVRMLGPRALDYLRGGYILALTPYEVGNALWKEATLIKRITLDEALTLLESLERVYEVMSIVSPSNTRLVLELAVHCAPEGFEAQRHYGVYPSKSLNPFGLYAAGRRVGAP